MSKIKPQKPGWFLKNAPVRRALILSVVLFFLFPLALALGQYEAQLGFGRATTLLNQGKYLESLAGYQEVATFAVSPTDRARALFFMGTIYGLYLDQYDGACAHFDRVITSYPETASAPESLFNKGMVLYEKNEFAQAGDAFARYLELYPQGRRALSAQVWKQSAQARIFDAPKKDLPIKALGDTTLRILIRTGQRTVEVSADPDFQCTDPFSGKILFSGPRGAFTISKGRLWVGKKDLGADQCEIVSQGQSLSVGNAKYRGILILKVGGSGIEVINRVGVETYLYGVVPKEMSPNWPEEALKAQAIAARSYALYLKEKRKNEAFDLMATTASQVYGGYDEKYRGAIRAVDATRGQIMTHEGRVIIAYFHANSGGWTEDAGNVWVANLPYLKGISDSFSKNAPGVSWECVLSAKKIQNALVRSGMHVGQIKGLSPAGASASGRINKIRIMSDTGAISIKSNNFRIKLGPTKLKSTRFKITKTGDSFKFSGTGYGHGVGMSQWGAWEMAGSGKDYRQILDHYYRGVSIQVLDYALNAWLR